MCKKILAILLSSFIGIMASPELLSASNSVSLTGINNAGIVETVIPEPEPEPVVYANTATSTPVYTAVYVPQVTNYTVTNYSGGFVSEPNYYDIYKTNKLIYAHNTGNLLGNLVYRYPGEVFTITEGGVTRNYQVTEIRVYTLMNREILNYNGQNYTMKANAISGAAGYDVALMTCYGAYNAALGTSEQRWIVYANAI